MKVVRLEVVTNQLAKLSISSQLAGLSIDAPARRIKSIQPQRARMEVSRENPRIDIDMEQFRNNIGMKSIGTLTAELGRQAFGQARQAIVEMDRNGDAMAQLPHHGNVIAQIARNRMLTPSRPITGTGVAQDPTVGMTGHPGSLSVDWSMQDMSISWDENQAPVITLEPKPSVDIRLAQKPHIEFRVVEQMIPALAGRTIDEQV